MRYQQLSVPFRHEKATMLARSRWLRWCVAPLGLTLFACGGDGPTEPPTEPPPTPAAIALVSGDHQEGNAGAPLTDAFLVRVTDAQGDEVGNVEVTWSVTSGAGNLFSSHTGVPRSTTYTGADGLARAVLTPMVLGTTVVTAEVVGLRGSPVIFATEAGPPAWPPVSGSALIYWPVGNFLRFPDRYILYEDHTFQLQFDSGRHGFFGTYTRGAATIDFTFDADGSWRATGTFDGSDCLVVEYNIIMAFSDFEDRVYCPLSEMQ